MHLIRAATISVANLDKSIEDYGWLNYKPVERGQVEQQLALSWGAENTTGLNYAVLQPQSGRDIFVRMIEQDTHPDYKPLRTYGWAALEICTQDTIRVNEIMEDSPFEIIGPPRRLDGMDAIFPMQVKGRDQEIIYLTQISGDMPDENLPRASTLIDSLFILVLASPDLQKEIDWIIDKLGVDLGYEINLNYTMINKAFGLKDGTKHDIVTMRHQRDVFLEVDQYPDKSVYRQGHFGQLPPGMSMGSFIHPDFDQILDLNAGAWITPPVKKDGAIYKGKRAGTLRSPSGTLFEMIEA